MTGIERKPKTARRRWAVRTAVVLGVLLGAALWISLSRPLDGAETDLPWYEWLPRQAKTALLGAAGQQISQYVHRKMEARAFATDLTVTQLIARLFDEQANPVERRRDAYRLAKAGTPEAVAALQRYFQTASVADRAAIAQLLGSWGRAEHKEWLWPLLDDPAEQVVIGAIRGLSVIGGADVTARLAQLLASAQTSLAVKIAAALGLGTVRTDAAYDALMRARAQNYDPDILTAITQSLGKFPFSAKVAENWRDYLSAPATTSAQRVQAVEALADSSPAAVPFLLEVAGQSEDWRVRAGAAWAISAHDAFPQGGTLLLTLAENETGDVVRRRLYEALISQTDVPAERLLALVMAERDIAARVAGFNALGAALNRQPALAEQFDAAVVPELCATALSGNSLNIRMRAVFALRRASTPASLEALRQISQAPEEHVAAAAANGLK